MQAIEWHHMHWYQLFKTDIKAKAAWLYGNNTPRSICKALLTDGTAAMIAYRLMQAAQRCKLVPLAMLFNKLTNWTGGCIIGRNALFGPRFVLIHSNGVVINSNVRAGQGIFIEHQVTIGAEKGLSPNLGNNIFIGAGAKILGGVKIGNNVKIGANAVVLSDVPDGATAVGVPARIILPGNPENAAS